MLNKNGGKKATILEVVLLLFLFMKICVMLQILEIQELSLLVKEALNVIK